MLTHGASALLRTKLRLRHHHSRSPPSLSAWLLSAIPAVTIISSTYISMIRVLLVVSHILACFVLLLVFSVCLVYISDATTREVATSRLTVAVTGVQSQGQGQTPTRGRPRL